MLSVVIPVYNHLDLTIQIIENIQRTQSDIEYELIIVNDGSIDWTKKWLDNNKKSNWLVIHQENQWTNWAWNIWVEKARWEYILIVNNDILFEDGAFSKMIRWFDSDDIMMVNPVTRTPNTSKYWVSPFYFTNHIQWRCYMITQGAKELLFPIDKRLKIFGWDNIIFYKMIYAGYKLKIIKDVIVTHLESQTVTWIQNIDVPAFVKIMKEEWRYIIPVSVENSVPISDLVFWL